MAEQQSYLYLGLAGETGPGRLVDSGLFRLADGGNEWEPMQRGLPEKPAVRALAVHPADPRSSMPAPNPAPIAAPIAASTGRR